MSPLTPEEQANRPWGLEQVMDYLQIGRNTALGLFQSGKLKGRKVGRAWRTTRAAVDAFLMEGGGSGHKE